MKKFYVITGMTRKSYYGTGIFTIVNCVRPTDLKF